MSVELGFLVGAIPTAAMIVCSCVFSHVKVGPLTEACFQSFAAGLILAAVAAELFPLIMEAERQDIYIGVSAGFFIALSMIHGVEWIVEYIEALDGSEKGSDHGNAEAPGSISMEGKRKRTHPEGVGPQYVEMSNGSRSVDDLGEIQLLQIPQWEDSGVDMALQAINIPAHKQHIFEHLQELMDSIRQMDDKCNQLTEENVPDKVTEEIAEFIDQKIHDLHYKVDHCRRLIEGAESEIQTGRGSIVTEERKQIMQKRLSNLRSIVAHLIDHMREIKIDGETLKEIHEHLDQMESQINSFHESIQVVGQRWTPKRELPVTKIGDKVPYGLVVPVIMDCFTDGFLIGVAVALSYKAGIILGAANCLEMSFLGMAYSTRLVKCTGSSALERTVAMYSPPLLMFLSSGFGAFLADAARSVPAVYVGFVSFGVVALLFLVCNELIIEARSNQGDDGKWWVSILIFLGIYVVLMGDT